MLVSAYLFRQMDDPFMSGWALLAAAVGAAGVVAGLWMLVVAKSWGHTGSARYRRGVEDAHGEGAATSPPASTDDVAAWDALTRGDDPS